MILAKRTSDHCSDAVRERVKEATRLQHCQRSGCDGPSGRDESREDTKSGENRRGIAVADGTSRFLRILYELLVKQLDVQGDVRVAWYGEIDG